MTFGEPMFPSGRKGGGAADDPFGSPGGYGFDDPFGPGSDDSPFPPDVSPASARRESGGLLPKALGLLALVILVTSVLLILPAGPAVESDATLGLQAALGSYLLAAAGDTAEQRSRGRLVWVALLRPLSVVVAIAAAVMAANHAAF